ncbi:unnamed protein product [Penicillium salamii]|nr:unnamed protein product [Penicillium salamii]
MWPFCCSLLPRSWLIVSVLGVFTTQSTAAGVSLDIADSGKCFIFSTGYLAIRLLTLSEASIKSAASQIAFDLVTFYTGNNTGDTPGNLPDPYYWWEAGAFFGALVNYWSYTGDSVYNDITKQAMIHQAGKKGDFMPENQTYTEGNDDQCFWALSAMIAAERNFPAPSSPTPGWLAMVQAVFNEQAHRWDTSACGGGLRWQIYTWNSGYLYRNSIANGCFFDIASRLARYTGNETYAKWATKAWDWTQMIGLIGTEYEIFDGVTDVDNCTSHDHNRWSYNAGVWLHGASVMYNYTTEQGSDISSTWRERTDSLLEATGHFFPKNDIMFEHNCEASGSCNVDQLSFKAYLSRWLAEVTQYAPYTYDSIMGKLRATAVAAVAQCQGGDTGTFCGHKWNTGVYDGTKGVGQQMSVLEVLQGLLAADVGGALTSSTGGESEGNSAAGTGDDETKAELPVMHIDNGDRAGAAIVTAIFVTFVGWAVFGMLS